MKMRTAMEGRVVAVIKLHDDVNGVITDLAHDAAMAHALVMAMKEFSDVDDPYVSIGFIKAIEKRATELMREWGYTED